MEGADGKSTVSEHEIDTGHTTITENLMENARVIQSESKTQKCWMLSP